MDTFKYSLLSKIFFRYSILLLVFLLISYSVVIAKGAVSQPLLFIPVLVNIAVIYLSVKYFYNTYRRLPFIIMCGNKSLKALNFMPGQKPVEINYADIDNISGGVFGYNQKGVIYIHDGSQNIEIGVHPSIERVETLLRIILSRVNEQLRNELVEKLKRNKWIEI